MRYSGQCSKSRIMSSQVPKPSRSENTSRYIFICLSFGDIVTWYLLLGEVNFGLMTVLETWNY